MNIVAISSVYQRDIAWMIVVKSNVNLIAIVNFAKTTKNVKKKVTPMNKTCADCIHYDACKDMYDGIKADFDDKRFIGCCEFFADKSRYIELPCAVGDTVWFKRNGIIIETCVEKIVLKHRGLHLKLECNAIYETTVRSIGKTVFLTREDAEQALKGGE